MLDRTKAACAGRGIFFHVGGARHNLHCTVGMHVAHHVPASAFFGKGLPQFTHFPLQFWQYQSAFCLAWLDAFWGRGCPEPPLQGGNAQVVHQVPGVLEILVLL